MDKNIINFEQRKSKLLQQKAESEKLLDTAIENYNKILKGFSLRKEIKLKSAENIIHIREKNLRTINTELEYLRPRNEEDMAYRQRQYNVFSEYIKESIPDEIPLRFHGTSIYAAKDIIISGEISSPADRLGAEISYMTPGQIYVNTKENIFNTVGNFCNLTYDYDLPAGCLFVITPKDIEDEKTAPNQTMNSVYFKNNPDRLVAVISTPENNHNLKFWLKESGLSPEKAFTYDGFMQSIDKVIDSVVLPYREIEKNISQRATVNDNKSAINLDAMISNAKNRVSTQQIEEKNIKEIKNNIGGITK